MRVKIFMPKYMADFKCINAKCTDTCCAGWDINIDENTYEKYSKSIGDFKKLLDGKFTENKEEHDVFNHGFMILKDESKCPFLNTNMLCDIHGGFGEENLCITCKSYPRVFNIVDEVYEKSGLPSCEEICFEALLNKDKMEFIETYENIDEDGIEIRRIIDSEAFEGSESLLQYFWDIRVISINIMQSREFSIEERLNILKDLYRKIEELKNSQELDALEELLSDYNDELINLEAAKGFPFKEEKEFYDTLADKKLFDNVRSIKLKECLKEYKIGISSNNDIVEYLNCKPEYFEGLKKYDYIFENYLVNQIFKDLIPFNKGEKLADSLKILINSYRIIKAYVIGIAINSKDEINEKNVIRVIQALSKDIEHNKVFKELLEK
ncbi:flagellin lysine-N-methylase [Clostridium sp. BL-8]|uniref:flagellin lysine-N-methylase n=1 Tax=Clostridium sp. BL-8 TaxID=349938 RepID=UPI00098C2A03|nr:flagellin lysine-N-methylase [Clostridium sp. BL-8]OOM81431.1 flagellar biosynthetic protein FliU [Clostridium sp. BL-8]